MHTTFSKEQFNLSKEDSESIYQKIREDKKVDAFLPSNDPIILYVVGQPGSGKTTLKQHLFNERPELEKNTIVLNTDELRDYHPGYVKLQSDPKAFQDAPTLVNNDSSNWQKRLIKDSFDRKLNIVFDVTLGSPDLNPFLDGLKSFAQNGYKAEIHALSVPREVSLLGVHLRYEKQVQKQGYGRFVNTKTHEINYRNLPDNIGKMMDSGLLQNVSVYKKKIGTDASGKLVNNMVQCTLTSSSKEHVLKKLEEGRKLVFTNQEKQYLHMRLEDAKTAIRERGGAIQDFEKDIQPLAKEVKPPNQQKGKGFSM